MSNLFFLPRQFVVDGSGDPRAGAKLFFYEAGTLTSQDTYSDSDLATPNTNPVVADASGVFGPIYLTNSAYRVILKDSADVQIWDQDDVNTAVLGLFGSTFLIKSGSYTATADDKGALITFTATATLSLPAASVAAIGYTLMVQNKSTGTITIDPDGSELINGAASLLVLKGDSAILVCDGSAWRAIEIPHLPTQVDEAIAYSQWLTSTTFADITTAVLLEAGKSYAFELHFILNTDASADFKIRLHTDDTLTLSANPQPMLTVTDETAGTVQNVNMQAALDTEHTIDGSAGDQFCRITGTMQVNAAGTFVIQGAQNSPSGQSEITQGGLFSIWEIR